MIPVPKLVKNQDKLYAVVRTIPDHKEIDAKWWKYKLDVDYVYKAQGLYWFVNEIQEAKIQFLFLQKKD